MLSSHDVSMHGKHSTNDLYFCKTSIEFFMECFITAPDEIAPRHYFLLSGGGRWAGCESCEVTSLAPFPVTQFTSTSL